MERQIAYITENRSLEKVREYVFQSRVVGIDTETTSLCPLIGKVRLLQVSTVKETFVIDLFQVSLKAIKELFLDELMFSNSIVKVLQNAKFDLKFLETTWGGGIGTYPVNVFDTMLAAQLIYGGKSQGRSSLDALSRDWLGIEMSKDNQKWDWSGSIYKEQIAYAGRDATVLPLLYQIACQTLADNQLLQAAKLEFDCIGAVVRMELDGFKIDRNLWLDKCQKSKEAAYELEEKLLKELGVGRINLNSHPQMTKLLTEMAGFPITSTAKDYIRQLVQDYEPQTDLLGQVRDIRPALILLLQHKQEQKDLSAFGFNFLKFIHPKTGRIHASYNQMGADATHRFSCSDPKLLGRDVVIHH